MGRSLPHGLYSLLVVLLAVAGWFASLWQGDGCNYAIVTGPIVDQLEASNTNSSYKDQYITTLELGFDSYRELPNSMSIDVVPDTAPMDDGSGGANGTGVPSLSTNLQASLVSNFTSDNFLQQQQHKKARCVAYPEEVTNGIVDSSWTTSRSFAFLGLVLGGGGATFLLCSLCFVFSRVTWRWTGYELLLAAFCQALSLVAWFGTQLCSWNQCGWSMGSVSDGCAVVIWALAGGMVLFHYPSAALAPTLAPTDKSIASHDDDDGELEHIEKKLPGIV